VGSGLRVPISYESHVKELATDLPVRIARGEIVLPLYADLSRLPALERRAIFGLMVGNEGKTRVPVYETLTKAGFDPDRDMLQAPVMHPNAYGHANFWAGMAPPHWRQWGCGGLLVDWDLRTSLEGLYAAGGAIYGGGAHSSAAASGRYVGRVAAAAAKAAPDPLVDAAEVAREKARLYAPLERTGRTIGWKELNAGISRVMQDHCGQYRSEPILRAGLRLLDELREAEMTTVSAANPHELAHALECETILTVAEAVMNASLARRASSTLQSFTRLDYPEVDPPEWAKLLPIRQEGGEVKARDLPLDYHLRPPFEASYEENYRLHWGPGFGD
jgi:succinate dehydrogenase/fumarate reductase flavoprotein subunit